MKMKKFFFGAFGLLALASCTNDELVSVNRDGDEIAFSVVTNAPSRADTVFCNNKLFESFTVRAKHNSQVYIDGDVIKRSGSSPSYVWTNTSGNRYWPNTGNVTFYASHNGGAFSWSADMNSPTEVFSVEGTVASQKDFVYAVADQSKPTNAESKVALNFRHALSQIVFKAKNTNSNLYVDIDGVSVCNVYNSGTFTYPNTSTDNKAGIHNGNGSYPTQGVGVWSSQSTETDYKVEFTAVSVNGGETKDLTSTLDNGDPADERKAMLLIPQQRSQWDGSSNPGESSQTNTYFLVNCRIFNIAGTSFVDPESAGGSNPDVCLWGELKEGKYVSKPIAIPVALDWKPGMKYVYTFEFGTGNGGYDPETQQPVLLPITFSVTVDDFVTYDYDSTSSNSQEDIPVEMNKAAK